MKLVKIEWLDIKTWPGWNEELVQEGKHVTLEVTTVGYLVRKTKTTVTISDSSPHIGNVTVFPRGCIRTITEIK